MKHALDVGLMLVGEKNMHGLIFVTWEKYLAERFGSSLLTKYRETIGEAAATSPLASRVYDDTTLLEGVGVACKLTRLSADTLLSFSTLKRVVKGHCSCRP